MAPVHMSAKFWVKDSDSAGREKSDAPASTIPHFMTGALGGSVSKRRLQSAMIHIAKQRETEITASQGRVGGGVGIPEMHRLGPNGRVPEACKARGLSAGGGVDSSAGIPRLAEEGPEGAEDAGAGAERHAGLGALVAMNSPGVQLMGDRGAASRGRDKRSCV